MKELDVIDLPDGRRGTVVYVHPTARIIIVEVESELIDYEIGENGLKEISRMAVGPEGLASPLIGGRKRQPPFELFYLLVLLGSVCLRASRAALRLPGNHWLLPEAYL